MNTNFSARLFIIIKLNLQQQLSSSPDICIFEKSDNRTLSLKSLRLATEEIWDKYQTKVRCFCYRSVLIQTAKPTNLRLNANHSSNEIRKVI